MAADRLEQSLGGNITWKIWDWGDPAYSLTGDGNIGWVRAHDTWPLGVPAAPSARA